MAKTQCDLYRSVMDKSFKSIKIGTYPGDGVLDPRWEATEYFSRKLNRMVTSKADVDVVIGQEGRQLCLEVDLAARCSRLVSES